MKLEQSKNIIDIELEERIADLNFINIDIKINEEIAKLRYLNYYDLNIDSNRDCNLSYNQWLIDYKLKAIKLYIDLL